jgi:hypothetical protein
MKNYDIKQKRMTTDTTHKIKQKIMTKIKKRARKKLSSFGNWLCSYGDVSFKPRCQALCGLKLVFIVFIVSCSLLVVLCDADANYFVVTRLIAMRFEASLVSR